MKRNSKSKTKEVLSEALLEIVLTAVFFAVGFGIFAIFGGTERAWETDGDLLSLIGLLVLLLLGGAFIFVCHRLRRRLRIAIHGREGISLVPMKKKDFPHFYATIVSAFVREERRDEAAAREMLKNSLYTVYRIVENDRVLGYLTVWRLPRFAFVEHFVIFDEYRGHGYGGKVLDIVKEAFGRLVLEAEPPEDGATSARRVAFYERNGFRVNDCPYEQPSYYGEAPVPLVLMSYPDTLNDFDGAVATIYEKVYFIKKD